MNGIHRNSIIVMLMCISLSSQVKAVCNPRIPLNKPDSRYVDNKDGTITDTVTGLMWKQCPEGVNTTTIACDTGNAATFTWQQAQQHVTGMNTANARDQHGYDDWRLPDLKELKSLSEMACYNPAINIHLFPGTPSGYFWSSTSFESAPDNAWGVGFYYGGDRLGKKEEPRHVRVVRTIKK